MQAYSSGWPNSDSRGHRIKVLIFLMIVSQEPQLLRVTHIL